MSLRFKMASFITVPMLGLATVFVFYAVSVIETHTKRMCETLNAD